MAVRVTVTRATDGSAKQVDTIEDGVMFLVRDAHLFVMSTEFRDAKTLAAYAPGQWLAAKVVSKDG